MLGITMLVIAALVGTRDLGQMVFGWMTSANFGMGVIAGCSLLMAMLSDRVFQALSAKQARRLGVPRAPAAGLLPPTLSLAIVLGHSLQS